MNQLTDIFSLLPYAHHAYMIESSYSIYPCLEPLLPKDDFSYIVHKQFDTLSIADVRTLKSLQSEKTEKASLFIIEVTVVNHEAQNALLKMLEEPASDTYFVFVVPSIKKLLPTLQSRVQHIYIGKISPSESIKLNVADFSQQSLMQRFEVIKKHTDKKNSESLDKKDILMFLDDYERYMEQEDNKKTRAHVLGSILRAKEYLSQKGASHKMILETLAIQTAYES